MNIASGNTLKSQAVSGKKDWENIVSALEKDSQDPTAAKDANAGGESAVNDFFKQVFADADDDTKRAMIKSFQESGGTTLSTNWEEVKQGKVEGSAPPGV